MKVLLADLHRHLDGSIRPATLAELAGVAGVEVPDDIRFVPGMGLDKALARFRTTLAVLQQPAMLSRVAAEICEDAVAGGVSTLEIRFAPQLHGDLGAAIDAVVEGCSGRAGIILCGLYGDPPDLVMALVRAAEKRNAVVGLDIAGAPSQGHRWALHDYADAFQAAQTMGLGRTVHAGEGRDASEIRVAVELLRAQRIGHATTLLDDPQILELVLERDIAIEACVTSNVHTGAVADASAHPLPRWLGLGVRACVCTDNTLLSDVSSREEHQRVRNLAGMTDESLTRAIANGHSAAFARE